MSSALKTPVIGLIGGIGSGKSLVARLMAEAVASQKRKRLEIISGDQLGHEALRQPEVKEEIVKRWGKDVLNERGEADRRRLGGIVFADSKEREHLERLSFPWIERGIQEQIDKARNDPGVSLVVLDAAIMLEAGWNRSCDYILFVDVPRELRLERLTKTRGWSEKELEAREKAQWPLTEKRKHAQSLIDNSGTPEQTAAQVDRFLRERKWI